MKRFAVLLITLFALTTALAAAPFFPAIKTTYPLSTGRTLTLDFAAPKEALPFFDSAILTEGLSKLMADSKLDADLSIMFVPRNARGDIVLSLSFDKIDPASAEILKPVQNPYNLRCLPLFFPRNALQVLYSWYASFLANESPDKKADFLATGQKITFTVFYSFKGQAVQLTLRGFFPGVNIMSGIAPTRAIFDPSITYMDMKTFQTFTIKLYSDSNLPYLQNSYMFMLDPIEDPKNPGIAMPSSLVYPLFGMKP